MKITAFQEDQLVIISQSTYKAAMETWHSISTY